MGAVFQPAVAMPCRFGGQGGLSANQAAWGPLLSVRPLAPRARRCPLPVAWAGPTLTRRGPGPASSSELGSFGF